jgi:hypothetical protein
MDHGPESIYRSVVKGICGWEKLFPSTGLEEARQSLDEPVGPHDERLRQRDAQRAGGPEIDRQLEARGLLDGKIAGVARPRNC